MSKAYMANNIATIDEDEIFMKRALELARKGYGTTNPNPLVGAVFVKNGKVIAEGYHKKCGSCHAEVDALANATSDIRGSTLYVNLEPCCHFGKTPPCTDAIIKSGVKKVVAAMLDPNPLVSGNGIEKLKQAGIITKVGVLEEEAKKLNEIFIKYITQKQPFVIMKYAMTLDGKIASVCGDSKWISSEKSRQYVHQIRNRVSSIIVGINTVIKDNPSLTTRLTDISGKTIRGNDPIRIVVDSKGKIPLNSQVVESDSDKHLILATTSLLDKEKEQQLIKKNVKVIKCDGENNKVDLKKLIKSLYNLGIDSILLEGGSELNAEFLKENLVDKVIVFIAPKLIGGKTALSPIGGSGINRIIAAINLKDIQIRRFDDDLLIEGMVKNNDKLNF